MHAIQKGLSIVGFAGLLISSAWAPLYAQTSTYRDVFYLDSVPHLHLLYAQDSTSSWADINWLSPPISSGSPLTMAPYGNQGQLFFIYTNQVYQLYQQGPGSWGLGTTGGPASAAGSALTSFMDYPAYIAHAFYEGTNGHVYELNCNPCVGSGAVWHSDDPTSLAGAPIAVSGSALTSFIDLTSSTHYMHVYYLGTNHHVYELVWTGGATWSSNDRTSLAGAPVAVSGSALTGFNNTSGAGDTGEHMMYLGTNGHVYALHSTPAWGYFDVTAASGGVAAASGSKLTSFQDYVTGGVRLYFIGTNSHVYELYWPSEGTASETDLTVASGAGATAALGSALAGSDGLVHY